MGSIYTMASFPGLASSGLCREAWNTLAVQGSLWRKAGRPDLFTNSGSGWVGRQQSRYVGKVQGLSSDQARTHAVAGGEKIPRTASAADRRRQQCLRRTKRESEPLLRWRAVPFTGG